MTGVRLQPVLPPEAGEGMEDPAGSLLLYGRSGPLRLEASFERAFRQLGWSVTRYSADPEAPDLAWWLRSRVGRKVTRGSGELRRWGSRRRNARFLHEALDLRPDLVLLINGAFIMPETVDELRDEGIPVAVFHPDAPVRGNINYRPEHLPVARRATAVFLWSRDLVARWNDSEDVRAIYLPFAWDPDVFPHVAGDPGSESNLCDGPEVVFVGGWDRRRERWLEPVAERFDLKIWGPYYWGTHTRRRSLLRECWQGRALRGREAAEAVAGADIALNVLRDQNLPDGTNMRAFEVPGAGGFLLSTRTSGVTEIYPEGEAGAYFRSVEEMLKKIDHYLTHPEDRRIIARSAHKITAESQQYRDRARQILENVRQKGRV